MRLRNLALGLGLGLAAVSAIAQTPITFVRHGETIANATGKYSNSTLNTLTEKGNQQVELLAKTLPRRFAGIYVSPAGRCLRTIAPYLKATGQKATIWPELLECCHQRGAERNKPAGPLQYGPKITVPQDLKPYFVIEPGHEREISSPTYKAGLRQIDMAAERIRKLPANESFLLVSHSIAGARLFEALTGKPNRTKIDNARPITIERTGGAYSIKRP